MQRVLVIGCPGAGKTYFSRTLAAKTGLPLIHLDFPYHQPGWDSDPERKRSQWRTKVAELVQAECWIIDGNYKNTFDIRFPAADTIIFLDYPRWLTLGRTLKRRLQYHRQQRSDMPSEWKEHLTFTFLKFIWNYRGVERPKVLALLQEHAEGRTIHIFTHPRQAERFLRTYSQPNSL